MILQSCGEFIGAVASIINRSALLTSSLERFIRKMYGMYRESSEIVLNIKLNI